MAATIATTITSVRHGLSSGILCSAGMDLLDVHVTAHVPANAKLALNVRAALLLPRYQSSGTYVIAVFQQVRRKAVAEGVTASVLGNTPGAYRFLHGVLNRVVRNVMTP